MFLLGSASATRVLRSRGSFTQQLRSSSLIALAIKPVFEDLSKENASIAFGLVDVDENSDAALEFGVNAVPTFLFFVEEKAIRKMAGADANQLAKLINDLKSR